MIHSKLYLPLAGFLTALPLLLATHAFGQDSSTQVKTIAAKSLEMAKQVSAASGRPIFAVAGRST